MSMSDLLSQPTYRSTKGRVPIFRPQLNGSEFAITVKEAVFSLGDKSHDMAMLSCTSTELTNTDGMLDAAIAFYYGAAPRTELFCGYIVLVSESKVGQGNISFDLMVLGATQVMQKGKPRFWRNKAIPSAVSDLSGANRLGVYTHTNGFLWGKLAQTTESDWKTASMFTARLGWSLYNRYGILLCVNPSLLHKDSGPYATLVSAQDHDFDPVESRRLIEFNPSEKSTSAPEYMGEMVAYFNDSGAVQITKEIGEFKNYKFVTEKVISGVEEADIYANAGVSKVGAWLQRAEARIWGDSDIYPGMNVEVITTNTRYLKAKYDGRWLVESVKHQMDTQQFQTQLTLARPSGEVSVTSAAYEPFWQSASKSRPALSLQDNVWVSTWADPRVEAVV